MKTLIKSLIPPLALRILKGKPKTGFFGDFGSWEQACASSSGYHGPSILEKVESAVLAVKEGRAAYERDSVLFQKPEYPWPLLACLLQVATANGNRLRVLDFGGSLGSTFFQCWKMLSELEELRWSVIEQKHFVESGKKSFAGNGLEFHFDFAESLKSFQPHVLLLSSVLQYLPDPHVLLREAIALKIPHIIVDRTAFISGRRDRLTLQVVPPEIYRATYPAWFLGEDRFLEHFRDGYELSVELECKDRANFPSEFKGFHFKAKAGQP